MYGKKKMTPEEKKKHDQMTPEEKKKHEKMLEDEKKEERLKAWKRNPPRRNS